VVRHTGILRVHGPGELGLAVLNLEGSAKTLALP
jgi:hypothetical protein